MNNEKINSFALSTIIFSYTGATFYGIFSSYIINKAKTFTMIAMIIGYIISVILSIIILKFFNSNINLNFNNKLKKAYGKMSIIINLLFTITSIALYILFIYRFTNFLSTQYLIETSKVQILILVIILTYYMSTFKIETITRVCTITLYIGIVLFLFNYIGLINEVKLNNFLPIIIENPKGIIESIIVFVFYFTSPLVFINIIKKNNLVDKEKFNKSFLFMQLISFIIMFIAMGLTLGTYGINVSTLFDYPLYTVLKKIVLFSFLDSIENVRIMLWLLCCINASSITLLFVFENIKETFKLNDTNSKTTNIIITIFTFIIPYFIFIKNNFVESFHYIYIPLIITIILYTIITITLIILKQKKNLND